MPRSCAVDERPPVCEVRVTDAKRVALSSPPFRTARLSVELDSRLDLEVPLYLTGHGP